MRPQRKISAVFFVFNITLICIGSITNAQEVISTAGDYLKNEAGSISFTLGEVMTENYIKDGNILNQGFQQSNLKVTTIKDNPLIDLKISIFPNPTSEFVKLKVDTERMEGIKIKILDQNGKLIQIQELKDSEFEISFENLSPATYFIIVFNEKNEFRTYKIIKQ